MADIRYLNQFGMPGGFNITSGEPIDSRAYVADIEHIYSADNWKTVKPYEGLIVSAPDGQVRICVDAVNYTSKDAWKEVGAGAGAIQVETYEEAIAAANSDKLGQIIYISNGGTFGEGEGAIEYTAGAYIVTGDGALSKLGTTSVSGDIAGDVETLKGDVATLKTDVNGLQKSDELQENLIHSLQGQAANLSAALNGDGFENPGLISRVESLEGIDHTQYENTIETIKVNGVEVSPVDKVVDITIDAPVYDEVIDENSTNDKAPTSKAVYDLTKGLSEKINKIEAWKLQVVVEGTPENNFGLSEISHKTIYLSPVKFENGDISHYIEYIFVDTNNDETDTVGTWEKLGEFKGDIDPTQLQTSITDLGTRVDNIETKLANYDTLVSNVAAITKDLNEVTNDVDTLETNLAHTNQNIEGINENITTINNDLSTAKTNINANGEAISVLEGQISRLKVSDVKLEGTSLADISTGVVDLEYAKPVMVDVPDHGSVLSHYAGGLMSADDKEKLDGIATISTTDIDAILGLTPTE